jgi:hypothetical protein
LDGIISRKVSIMYQFIHDHVGYIESTTNGFQVGMSWGVFFGAPITLAALWVFSKVSKVWHRFAANANHQPA